MKRIPLFRIVAMAFVLAIIFATGEPTRLFDAIPSIDQIPIAQTLLNALQIGSTK